MRYVLDRDGEAAIYNSLEEIRTDLRDAITDRYHNVDAYDVYELGDPVRFRITEPDVIFVNGTSIPQPEEGETIGAYARRLTGMID